MTGPNPPSAQIDQLMTGLRETLAQARAGRPAEDPGTAGLQGKHGEDDAQIKAVVGPNRIVSLELDPRVRRMDSDELAAAIVAAINGAFEDLGGRAREAAGEESPDVDTEALSEKLDKLQDASVRQMAMFEQAMSEVVARLMGGRS
ncbi:hypothetical protein Afil01_50510 [Actinorhabdospora filicis]|uniref:YbaB/EbfC DNA-binding family protein n=1 Tax=Actinorhabdospora filicis TaxID=1785913 RepID=A0A9W6SQP6_9ACTN|nr:hypothetical protein [Actinorhabdospora filicis]GLZ80244.1 hypothetical protein Afil01_50510 [Actinorhabdospora filicis]